MLCLTCSYVECNFYFDIDTLLRNIEKHEDVINLILFLMSQNMICPLLAIKWC